MIVTDAVMPSMVAVNVVVPPAIALTAPLLSTVATDGCEEVHVTCRPVSAFPALSRGVAVTVSVSCGATMTAVVVSAMVATRADPGAVASWLWQVASPSSAGTRTAFRA